LLLSSLSKVTPSDHKHFQTLLDGLAATKRIADTVNNAQRQQENEVVFEALMYRLKDWKGVPINQYAPLLLDDLFAVSSDQNGSGEYHVFLFERLMVLCVPAPPDIDRKATSVFKRSASSNVLNLQAQASGFLTEGVVASRKAITQLILKGALYIRSFEDLETIESGRSMGWLVGYSSKI
jgi:cell division control protein 24